MEESIEYLLTKGEYKGHFERHYSRIDDSESSLAGYEREVDGRQSQRSETDGKRVSTILECIILTCERCALGMSIAEPPSHPSNSSALPMRRFRSSGESPPSLIGFEPGMVGVAADRRPRESRSGRYADFLPIVHAANIRWGGIGDGHRRTSLLTHRAHETPSEGK